MTRFKVKVTTHGPFKVGNPAIFKSYFLCHLQWELATDHEFLNQSTISKFHWAGSLIFGLVFVSHNFEVGRNVNSEESTVSPIRSKFLLILVLM